MSLRNIFFTLVTLALLTAGLFFAKNLSQSDTFSLSAQHTLDSLNKENQNANQTTDQITTQNLAPNKPDESIQIENLNSDELAQWKSIEDILINKNDNDPLLDQITNQLSEKMRAFLHEQYKKMPAEKLNERGTLIYISSKNIKSLNDLEFLKSVVSETPCLSLENCTKLETSSDSDNHHEDTNATTLAYPQLVALYELDKNLEKNSQLLKDNNFKNEILEILSKAETFPAHSVQQKSRNIRQKYKL